MMRKNIVLFAIALQLTGCGDPETSRLSQGSKATVYDKKDSYVFVDRDGEGFPVRLDVGTEVRVVDDMADVDDSPSSFMYRKIRINPIQGELAGKAVEISRHNLRPAK